VNQKAISPTTAKTLDANEAAASIAYRLSETIAIYPITPSSPMAEFADEWSAKAKKNLWGQVPSLVQMQSEAGVAGTLHGMLQTGTMATTFTASQGLLLMIPNMYKIAGELLPFVMHVTARTLAAHALSIFGDHSDVMACRQTGFAMLCSNSVQEAHDLALICHAATLKTRVPFLHFFDGFRTSHEVNKIQELPNSVLEAMVDEESIAAFRQLALTPDAPRIRGTAQNPDTFFQAREACNKFYDAVPGAVEALMEQFGTLTGRNYKLFEYEGHPTPDRLIILMGSGAEAAHEAIEVLNEQGYKVGILKVRLFRPFSVKHLAAALPKSVRSIAVLDRTKEPGAVGDPLYLEVVTALREASEQGMTQFEVEPIVVAGRYGLSSKEFTPAMIKGIFDELAKEQPKRGFTVGIQDDVTHHSLPWDASFDTEPSDVTRAVFFGLGADGTVGANKNSIKIIGEETDNYAQGYFVYDSKKSGAMTISHLRFGPRPIRSSYLITRANFVACHQWEFLEKYDVLEYAEPNAVFLVNSPHKAEDVWDHLAQEVQSALIEKKLRFYVIDAYAVAKASGMGGRINTIMQTCFFAISGVLPRDEAIAQIKSAIEKTYSKKGADVVQKNFAAVDATLAALHEVKIPAAVTSRYKMPPIVPDEAPDFVRRVQGVMLANKGDALPVSAFPVDGTWPMATTQWEKRNIALEIPSWDSSICIQCNKCVLVCPHAAVRAKFYDAEELNAAPATFKSTDFRSAEFKGKKFTIQIAAEDCTGCTLCSVVCPAKDKANPKHKALDMVLQAPLRESERTNYDFFLKLPDPDRSQIKMEVKSSQFLRPLFEYSGACAGCGETPYVKLLTQLYGDRLYIANATGCSSIYGGNLPTTPYTVDHNGRGPSWSNSLFEDNAEYGLGHRLAVDQLRVIASDLLKGLAPMVGDELVRDLLAQEDRSEAGMVAQRQRVAALREKLRGIQDVRARRLNDVADYLVRKTVWILGGDGWAYDIGYGGLDHVLSLNYDVNILVMDTEVYSNTGGQASKSTPMGASAKFATAGKVTAKKDLGLIAMSYGSAYVARVAMGSKDSQVLQAFTEAESYPGTSLIIAYSHCIAHGYGLQLGLEQQKLAVDSGHWPLFRYDPRRSQSCEPPLKLDSSAPKTSLSKYLANEIRYRVLEKMVPDRAKALQADAQEYVRNHYHLYEQLARVHDEPQADGSNGSAEQK
jgi:pyruvate-ferredoxin/flavodoxin oxidoreductase